MTGDQPRVEWLDDSTVAVDGTKFLVSEAQEVYASEFSNSERFLLVKSPDYLRSCLDRFLEIQPENLLELGIWQGGSVVFWNLALRPKRQLAIDLYDRLVEPLRIFVDEYDGPGELNVRFGIDQADEIALNAALNDAFGNELIDVVVDDASHSYAETRKSFEVIFPRVRPGGMYVVEDWAWAHTGDMSWDVTGFATDRPALSNLLVEFMLVCGARSGIVEEVLIDSRAVYVRRGAAPIDGRFQLGANYFNRGLPYRPLL